MLEKKSRMCNCYSERAIIRETREHFNKEDITVEDVLCHLLGDSEGWHTSEYVVYKYEDVKDKTFLQRFNMLWVVPLFILTIPYQYLVLGEVGVNRNSKVGQIVGKLVGWN